MQVRVSAQQIRWFAVRRLATSALFTAAFLLVALLIVWVDYRFMLFSFAALSIALMTGAYGSVVARLAWRAQTVDATLAPGRITRRQSDQIQTDEVTNVWVYPSHLAVHVTGTGVLDLPISTAELAELPDVLEREGIAYERMSGLVGTLAPVIGVVVLFVVLAIITRLVVVAVIAGGVALAGWSPWLGGAVLAALVLAGAVVFVGRLMRPKKPTD